MNSVTIFNLSTFAQLGCKINVWKGCVPANQAEVDKFSIVTEFPCLLGHTVYNSISSCIFNILFTKKCIIWKSSAGKYNSPSPQIFH